MNILKNVFNWTVGSFFRTIGRIIAFIVIGFIIFQLLSKANIDITNIFMPKLSAATLTPRSTYSGNTYFTSDEINGFGNNNTYSYSDTTPSVQGRWYFSTASTGSTVSGKAWALSMGFSYNLMANKYYDITINFRDRDLRSNVTTSSIRLFSGDSTASLTANYISLIGVTNDATSSSNTNKLVVRIFANSPTSLWGLSIVTGGSNTDNITSVNNFGISSVTIDEVDTTNSQEIINNQTNNTQNIINNQNNTTQQIIDSQNELLGQRCGNLYNFANYQNGSIGNNSTDESLSSSNQALTTDWITVDLNTTYYITGDYNRIRWQLKNGNTITFGGVNSSVNTGNNTQLRAYYYWSDTATIGSEHKISISKSNSYCEYGSYSSKLDETNDLLNDDDTSSATNQATSFFNNFNDDDHGLASIITLPLNSIRLMLSDTCVAPHTVYKGVTITLPCGDILWSRQGANNLKDFLNVVYGGFICYYILVNFLLWINRFKNPENDKIEVLDL